MKILFISIFLIMSPSILLADGNSFIKSCEEAEFFLSDKAKADKSIMFYCIGVIHGVKSTMYMTNDSLPNQAKTCFPESADSLGIKNSQAIRIVLKYLKNNPAELNLDEALLVYMALHDAYPCK